MKIQDGCMAATLDPRLAPLAPTLNCVLYVHANKPAKFQVNTSNAVRDIEKRKFKITKCLNMLEQELSATAGYTPDLPSF